MFISLFIYAVLNIFIAIVEDAFFASKQETQKDIRDDLQQKHNPIETLDVIDLLEGPPVPIMSVQNKDYDVTPYQTKVNDNNPYNNNNNNNNNNNTYNHNHNIVTVNKTPNKQSNDKKMAQHHKLSSHDYEMSESEQPLISEKEDNTKEKEKEKEKAKDKIQRLNKSSDDIMAETGVVGGGGGLLGRSQSHPSNKRQSLSKKDFPPPIQHTANLLGTPSATVTHSKNQMTSNVSNNNNQTFTPLLVKGSKLSRSGFVSHTCVLVFGCVFFWCGFVVVALFVCLFFYFILFYFIYFFVFVFADVCWMLN